MTPGAAAAWYNSPVKDAGRLDDSKIQKSKSTRTRRILTSLGSTLRSA